MSIDIGGMRKPYLSAETTFDVKDLVAKEPFGQFKAWFDEATRHEAIEEANAMCLATADADGVPSARMVLLKEFGEDGFVFYTNYGSRKGKELSENPKASLVFYWPPLKRSVRVEGDVERVSGDKSDAYFDSRPIGSKIGAAVSEQSAVIRDRDVLTKKESELKEEFGDGAKALKRPEQWGGFVVVPRTVEFWQGQSTRLHDRLRFRKKSAAKKGDEEDLCLEGENGWVIERLAP